MGTIPFFKTFTMSLSFLRYSFVHDINYDSGKLHYLFGNVFLWIPWHNGTHSFSSRTVICTFHCSCKANCCMGTKRQNEMLGRSSIIWHSNLQGKVLLRSRTEFGTKRRSPSDMQLGCKVPCYTGSLNKINIIKGKNVNTSIPKFIK